MCWSSSFGINDIKQTVVCRWKFLNGLDKRLCVLIPCLKGRVYEEHKILEHATLHAYGVCLRLHFLSMKEPIGQY